MIDKPESLIFDMDGTLWDAVPTYAKAWNLVLQNHKIDRYLHTDSLYPLMGLQAEEYLSHVLPEQTTVEREDIYQLVIDEQYRLISSEGGRFFEGVEEGIKKLSKRYPLMILSNCPQHTIRYFLKWSGLGDQFIDYISYGESPQSKAENMKLLMDRNKLKSTVYIGDTQSDSNQAAIARVPFAFVTYGFGQAENYQLKFDSFRQLTEFFLSL